MSEKTRFFQSINYASFHEDSDSERRALRLRATDRVLCLTGSGARALDLLIDNPKEIVAIDWNPAQSHLLELKLAVIGCLSYDEGLGFLGLLPSNHRDATYIHLRPRLSAAAQSFWDSNPGAIQLGIYFDGRWERFLRKASWIARRIRHRMVDQLFDCEDLDAQQQFWRQRWDNRRWRWFLNAATSRLLVRHILREPGLQYVPQSLAIGDTLRRRFAQASGNFMFRESPWVWALFKGTIDIGGPVPEHLKAENFDKLRARVDSVQIVTASLQDYLRKCETRFDAFSLSDFASYCDQETHGQIWKAILDRSNHHARFCERRFLVEYPLDPDIQKTVQIDTLLSEKLTREDRAVVYTFLIASLEEASIDTCLYSTT